MSNVTYDLTDPAFPHGTPRGRTRGCACEPCVHARTTRDKRVRVQRAAGRRPAFIDPTLTARARAHVAALTAAVPHATVADLARAAGLSWHSVNGLVRDDRVVSAPTALRALRVDADTLRASCALVDARAFVHAARTIEALGYPLWWQAARTGHPVDRLIERAPDLIPAVTLRAALELAASIGDTPASADDGIDEEDVEAARAAAYADGFYPPICYDEETGELIVEALPDHRWARCDETAGRRLTVLRLILAGNTYVDISATVGTARRNVQRISEWLAETQATAEDPTAALDAIREHLWSWESGTVSAVLAGLRSGVLHPRAVAVDHPDLATWRAQGGEAPARGTARTDARTDDETRAHALAA